MVWEEEEALDLKVPLLLQAVGHILQLSHAPNGGMYCKPLFLVLLLRSPLTLSSSLFMDASEILFLLDHIFLSVIIHYTYVDESGYNLLVPHQS
jgi:hypothetical protein